MRITGGIAKGIPLKAPKGNLTRPATDAIREALFSSLGDLVLDADVLDLFAGTGAYGLDALSRGASTALFIESNPKTLNTLQENLNNVCKSLNKPASIGKSLALDALKFKSNQTFDLIFADPPYEQIDTFITPLFENIHKYLTPNPNARFILEVPGRTQDIQLQGLNLMKRLGKPKKNSPTLLIYSLDNNEG